MALAQPTASSTTVKQDQRQASKGEQEQGETAAAERGASGGRGKAGCSLQKEAQRGARGGSSAGSLLRSLSCPLPRSLATRKLHCISMHRISNAVRLGHMLERLLNRLCLRPRCGRRVGGVAAQLQGGLGGELPKLADQACGQGMEARVGEGRGGRLRVERCVALNTRRPGLVAAAAGASPAAQASNVAHRPHTLCSPRAALLLPSARLPRLCRSPAADLRLRRALTYSVSALCSRSCAHAGRQGGSVRLWRQQQTLLRHPKALPSTNPSRQARPLLRPPARSSFPPASSHPADPRLQLACSLASSPCCASTRSTRPAYRASADLNMASSLRNLRGEASGVCRGHKSQERGMAGAIRDAAPSLRNKQHPRRS